MAETNRRVNNEDERSVMKMDILQDIGSQIQQLGEKISDCGPNDLLIVNFSRVSDLKEIGKGRNGTTVFEGSLDGNPVAIKRFPKDHIKVDKKTFQFLKLRQHENVVANYEYKECRESVFMILELCEYSLEDLISVAAFSNFNISGADAPSLAAHKQKLSVLNNEMPDIRLWAADGTPSETTLNIMRQVLEGVNYLHENKFVHGDLKPSNILMVDFKNPRVKISDAGVIKCLHGKSSLQWPGSKAPELVRSDQCPTFSSDMFGVGCIFYYCLTQGHHPFGEIFDANIQHYDMNALPHQLTEEARHLILALLSKSPEERPPARAAIKHPFFWNPEKRMDFLCSISNIGRKRKMNTAQDALFVALRRLDNFKKTPWNSFLHPMLLADLHLSNTNYNYRSVEDLLRMLRNKWARRAELSKDIQTQLFDPFPWGQEMYYSKRFPKLLMEVYKLASQYLKYDPSFERYFPLGD